MVDKHERIPFSRIPIYEGSIDSTIGFVLKDEILERVARGENGIPLLELRRDLNFVPPTARLPQLLDRFLSTRELMAAVADEFGGLAGVVTLEDVVETVLDLEIVDEIDDVEDLRAAAREDWERRANRRSHG